MATQTQQTLQQEANDNIDVRELLNVCLSKWKWFAISVCVTCFIAVLYILCTPPKYTRMAEVLVKNESNRNSSSVSGVLSDLGLFSSGGSNVNNEMVAFQSPATMKDVVTRLGLDNNYTKSGLFHRITLYGDSLVINASFIGLDPNEEARFSIDVRPDGNLLLSDFRREGESYDGEVSGQLSDTLQTPAGYAVVISKGRGYEHLGDGCTLRVRHSSVQKAIEDYMKELSVTIDNDKTSVITLIIIDQSIQRAEDILNTLIAVYNEKWVEDKNQSVASASNFIDERLTSLEVELDTVDEGISSYKSSNRLPSIQMAASMYMEQGSEVADKLLDLNSQLYMARYIRSMLNTGSNGWQLLPASQSIGDAGTESQITEYNRMVLQRNSLVANSSESNPLVADMDNTLSAMRDAIAQSIDNRITALTIMERNLRQAEQQANKGVSDNPIQAKTLLSDERQQKVKESLFIFLLQKREENDLAQAFTSDNTRIITPPYGKMKPTSPGKRNILMVAFLLGLLIPGSVITFREATNTKIRGRKDLETISVPFVGEIPLCYVEDGRHRKHRNLDNILVVEEGAHDVANEAFRVLRTNLELLSSNCESEIMIFTSFNPGSGKSFIAVNTAVCLALRGKKVLLIDGDLRRGTASVYVGSPTHGLSDYLGGRIINLASLVVTDATHSTLDVLPVGMIPPNPTEILRDKIGSVIDALRTSYDYIIIDCPPVEVVADTRIIGEYADHTIFVVRAGMLERSMLGTLETFYQESRFKGLCVLLNGTEGSRHSVYGYGYGYNQENKKDKG